MSTSAKLSFDPGHDEAAVTPHELRRYHAGELSAERRAQIEAALAQDAALTARLDEMKAADAAFRASMPFERFVADHEARLQARGGLARRLLDAIKRFRLAAGAGAFVAAAAVVLVAVNVDGGQDRPAWDGTKGSHLAYFVKEAQGVRFGKAGEPLAEGDRIQFAVKDVPDARAMVLVGIDGEGAVTVYAAERLDDTREKGGKPRVLPQSVVLDDAVGPERFFVVYGDADAGALREQVLRAAKRLAATEPDMARAARLPIDDAGLVQSSVHIVKVKRP